MSKYITIKDIANELGISKSTVSRALSGDASNVKAETMKLITETARRMGYQRNELAVSLRKRFEKGLRLAGIAHIPSSANFVTLLMDPKTGAARMRSAGVSVLPLEEPGGIRITIGTEEQMQQVCRTLGFDLPGE